MREAALGRSHPEVAACLNNLAVLLKTLGRYGEAEQLYGLSIAIKERCMGPTHPQVPARAQRHTSQRCILAQTGKERIRRRHVERHEVFVIGAAAVVGVCAGDRIFPSCFISACAATHPERMGLNARTGWKSDNYKNEGLGLRRHGRSQPEVSGACADIGC